MTTIRKILGILVILSPVIALCVWVGINAPWILLIMFGVVLALFGIVYLGLWIMGEL